MTPKHIQLGVCLLSLIGGAAAQTQSLPVSARLGVESITLPGDEAMGLVGGSYLIELAPHWLAGPAVYGAASGHRGGFFVGGAELAYRLPLSPDWRLEAGLFAGGGGGGNAPVGGGLMLRPHVDLLWRVGAPLGLSGLWAGVSASRVDFVNGDIRSNQAGLVLVMDSDFAYASTSPRGPGGSPSQRGGVGFDRISLTAAQDQPRGGERRLGLAGFRLDQWLSPRIYWGLEAAGAAQGGADGYAEVLGTLGFEQPIAGTPLAVGARAALGLGGGGAVPTEGGVLAKAGASLSWRIGRDAFVTLEGGAATAPQGSFKARYAQIALGLELDHPRQGPSPSWSSASWVDGMEWDLAVAQVDKAARRDGSKASLQMVGLQLRRSLGDTFYLSGQAHSAFSGGAGAYSVGLAGLGAQTPVSAAGWSVGAEVLVGAAGGGGVDNEGGAIVQPMVKLNWDADVHNRVHLSLGRVRSLKGALDSPVLELAWGLAFGVPTR
jgi:hypothetical protein